MKLYAFLTSCTLALATASLAAQAPTAPAPVTAIKAGRLVDPATGTIASNQVILVQNGHFTAVGANVAIPAGAQVIDLSAMTVVPGLVDAHNHLALTYKEVPERNSYYVTTILDDTPSIDELSRGTILRGERRAGRPSANANAIDNRKVSRVTGRSIQVA